jgi:protein-tyrosine-phosphatase
MSDKVFNVLFLCTGNSARSIMAEAILNHVGGSRFKAYSAGSMPTGAVNPAVIEILEGRNIPTSELRSKSWDEFAAPNAPKLDFVFTVCDNAAGEVCPVWAGQPMTAHWGLEDPAAVEGDKEQKLAVFNTYNQLARRLDVFVNLPVDKLARHSLQKELDDIGAMPRS